MKISYVYCNDQMIGFSGAGEYATIEDLMILAPDVHLCGVPTWSVSAWGATGAGVYSAGAF